MKILLMVLVSFVFFTTDLTGGQPCSSRGSNNLIIENIKCLIIEIQGGQTLTARTDNAKRLFEFTRDNSVEGINEDFIIEISRLLDDAEDSVRYWVARCIGNFGVKAKIVAPKLINLLKTTDSIHGSLTSSSGIRFALKQMGVEVPPRAYD